MQIGACNCDEDLDDLVPKIEVLPVALDFEFRRVAADTVKPIVVSNKGSAPLHITNIRFEPAGAPYTVAAAPEASYEEISEGASVELLVVFHPPMRGPYPATMIIDNDDAENPHLEVPIAGQGGPPAIQVRPDRVSFDLVNQGQSATRDVIITNVGLDDLHVTGVMLGAESNPGFQLPATDNFGSGIIPVEGTARVRVDMLPSVTGAATGSLHILSDARDEADKVVPITASANLAPTVTLVEKVSRMSDYRTDIYLEVTLDATGTIDPEGDTFEMPPPGSSGSTWRILERPSGSQSILEPTSVATESKLYIDQVGIYRVEVSATDARGARGVAVATIRAIRDLALRLTWEPGPAAPCRTAMEPSMQCGRTDVDLHLVAPGGMVGDYFSGCTDQVGCNARCQPIMSGAVCRSRGLDCSYANRKPDWSTLNDEEDDPSLDIDDAYGSGPENISMNNLVQGDYLVQVHFCNDRLTNEGAVASVEVFFHGEPSNPAILGPVTLPSEGSLWLAGIIHYDPAAMPKFTLTNFNANPPIVDAASNLCTQ